MSYGTLLTERLSYVCLRMTLDRTIIWIGLIPIWRYGNDRTARVMPRSCVAVDIGNTA